MSRMLRVLAPSPAEGGRGWGEGAPAPLFRLLVLGGSRAAAALGSLSAVLLARGLPPDQLGLWSLALAVQDYALTIAGRGEGARDLVARIAASPARERIRWVGAVPHDEAPRLLAEHGILLLTSRYEASPTVVKEALRVMRPVVCTDVGDVEDWLDEDATGFVCGGTPEELAAGVLRATRLIEEGRYRHTEKIRRLDEAAIMDEVLDLYRCLATR